MWRSRRFTYTKKRWSGQDGLRRTGTTTQRLQDIQRRLQRHKFTPVRRIRILGTRQVHIRSFCIQQRLCIGSRICDMNNGYISALVTNQAQHRFSEPHSERLVKNKPEEDSSDLNSRTRYLLGPTEEPTQKGRSRIRAKPSSSQNVSSYQNIFSIQFFR